ncbi:hypothetical protein BC941DRAFT_418592 [Chlamydoabsidia padenii]|nr:hypothetical protein BC941DRAFT_418592 [Chlamydoabsidia padenii]
MSLSEPQPWTSNANRERKHRSLSTGIMSSSMVPLSPTSQQQQQRRRRHSSYHHRHHVKHRLSNASSYSTVSTYSPPESILFRPFNTFEVVFTNIIDCFIFTSAIALTAYNYWMGYIVDTSRLHGTSSSSCVTLKSLDLPSSSSSSSSSSRSLTKTSVTNTEAQLNLKQLVPEQPQTQPESVSSIKAQIVNVMDNDDDAHHADHKEHLNEEEGLEEDDEDRVHRIEETLQELIRQAENALSTTY